MQEGPLGAEVRARRDLAQPRVLYEDPSATLDNLREAVATLEDIDPIARRVLGSTHPLTVDIEGDLRDARAALRARETLARGST